MTKLLVGDMGRRKLLDSRQLQKISSYKVFEANK